MAAIIAQFALTSGSSLLLQGTSIPIHEAPLRERSIAARPVIEPPPQPGAESLPIDFGYEYLSYNSSGRLNRPGLKGLVIDFRF